MAGKIKVPSELVPSQSNQIMLRSKYIYDDVKGHTQEEINAALEEQIESKVIEAGGVNWDTIPTAGSDNAVKSKDIKAALEKVTGYFVLDNNVTEETVAKTVTVTDFPNLALGGSIKIKMTTKNTAANPTLRIGTSNAPVYPLYYNNEIASANNSWEEGEVISVYFDGTNYQASNAQGGGGKAEKIKYDNSLSNFNSNNVQEVVDEIDTIINGTPSREPVTILKDDTTWASGLANYTTGNKDTSSVNNISGYIDVSGASSVELTVNGSESIAANLYPGTCFYDESKVFISGYQCATGQSAFGMVVRTYNVPSNAKYMRCTIHNDFINDFSCIISYPAGNSGLVGTVASNASHITSLQESVNSVEQDLNNELVTLETSWSSGYVDYRDGTTKTSSSNNKSGYIDIDGAKKVSVTINAVTGTGADIAPGTCFYDESKVFISGHQCITGNDVAEAKQVEYDVPANAKYMRCSLNSNYTFTGYAYYGENLISRVATIEENISDLDIISSDVESIKTTIKGKSDKTTIITDITWASGYVSYANGAVNSSTSNKYSNYIDVAGASKVNITVNKTTTVSSYSPGTCFYDANKAYIIGYQPYLGQAESGYAQKEFPVPPNAAYMRTSLGNDYPFEGTIYYEGEIGLVNILNKDITSKFTNWYAGQIVAAKSDARYGQRYESDSSRVASGFISCEGAYRLDITLLTAASSTTAGLCFYSAKAASSVLNGTVAEVTGVNGIERGSVFVPADAKYFRTTIPASEDTSNFTCKLVFKDANSLLENTTSISAAKEYNPYVGHPSIYISEPTASVSTSLNGKTVDQLYAEYDTLVENYPHFISRGEDICAITDGTNSYDIRQYIIGFQDQGAISSEPGVSDTTFTNIWSATDNPKKILINAGMHGEEKAPCWGTMLAIKELLESNDDWALFIKSNFILKLIPCLNPYGFDRNTRNNIYGHDLNRNTSIGDSDRVAYIDWIGENSDALAVIDTHGTQGKYAYVPNAYYMKNHDIITRVTEKFAAAFIPTFSALWGSINSSYVSTFYPFLLAKYDPTVTTPNLAGCAGEMFSKYGMEEFAVETPCNISNGSRSDSDLRSCQITKMLLLNFIQVVGCYY